jgi:hypothetical protein
VGADDAVVDVEARSGEGAMAEQIRVLLVVSGEGQEVVNVGDFAEVGADWVQEEQLQVNVALEQVQSGLVGIAVEQVKVLDAGEVVQSLLDNIPVDHLLVGLAHLQDLVFDFVLEDGIEVLHIRVF